MKNSKYAVGTKCVVAAVAATNLALVGCTSIPGSSKPEAVSSYAAAPTQANVPTPEDDQPSDLLLRDFISASAHPMGNHQAARAFLTPTAAEKWRDTTPIVVLERTDIASDGASDGDSISYHVRGSMVGRLSDDGTYTPDLSEFEGEYRMTRVDGQWRISELPNAVVIERSDFNAQYTQRKVFFMEHSGDSLVPDPRWIYNGTTSLPNVLMSMLTVGPGQNLAKGVRNLLPDGTTARVSESEGGGYTVDLLGVSDLSQESWDMLAAQVVWTLASADFRGPYKILADGTNPVPQREDGWQIQNVSQFDPSIEVAAPLRAVAGGTVYEENGNSATGVTGWLASNWVESLAVSPQDSVFAAVTGEGDAKRTLRVGEVNQSPQTTLQADSITRPSWAPNSTDLYAVADGTDVYHFSRDLATGTIQRSKVNTDVLRSLGIDDPRISVFRVSHSGARALMIINGRVFVSVLESGNNNQDLSLGTPIEIGHQLSDTAVSADWRNDGTILVGTRVSDAPLWQLSMDGSESMQLSSRNLSAPVVAVASESNTIYATDSRALMQFDSEDQDTRFWREVPSMQGQRAVPVLAY